MAWLFRGRSAVRPRPGVQLMLERLEDRTLPAPMTTTPPAGNHQREPVKVVVVVAPGNVMAATNQSSSSSSSANSGAETPRTVVSRTLIQTTGSPFVLVVIEGGDRDGNNANNQANNGQGTLGAQGFLSIRLEEHIRELTHEFDQRSPIPPPNDSWALDTPQPAIPSATTGPIGAATTVAAEAVVLPGGPTHRVLLEENALAGAEEADYSPGLNEAFKRLELFQHPAPRQTAGLMNVLEPSRQAVDPSPRRELLEADESALASADLDLNLEELADPAPAVPTGKETAAVAAIALEARLDISAEEDEESRPLTWRSLFRATLTAVLAGGVALGPFLTRDRPDSRLRRK
jgi:hypothetical protein